MCSKINVMNKDFYLRGSIQGKPLSALVSYLAKLQEITIENFKAQLSEICSISVSSIDNYVDYKSPSIYFGEGEIKMIIALFKSAFDSNHFSDYGLRQILILHGITNKGLIQKILTDVYNTKKNALFESNFNQILGEDNQKRVFKREYSSRVLKRLLLKNTPIIVFSYLSDMGKTTIIKDVAGWIDKNNSSLENSFYKGYWFQAPPSRGGRGKQRKDFEKEFNFFFNSAKDTSEIEHEIINERYLIIINGFSLSRMDTGLIDWLTGICQNPLVKSKFIFISDDYSTIKDFELDSKVFVSGLKEYEIYSLLEKAGIQENLSQTVFLLKNEFQGNVSLIKAYIQEFSHKHSEEEQVERVLINQKSTFLEKCFLSKIRNAEDRLLSTSKWVELLYDLNYYPLGLSKDFLQDFSSFDELTFEILISEGLINVSLDLDDTKLYLVGKLLFEFLKGESYFKRIDTDSMFKSRVDKFILFTREIGFCWNDPEKLKPLDSLWIKKSIEKILKDLWDKKMWQEFSILSESVKYYYYVRGVWHTSYNLKRFEAGKMLSNPEIQFESLIYHTNILIKRLSEKESIVLNIDVLEKLFHENEKYLSEYEKINYKHLLGLYNSYTTKETIKAISIWKDNLVNPHIQDHQINTNSRYLAEAYFKNGDVDKSKNLLKTLLPQSKEIKFKRGEIASAVLAAEIQVIENSNPEILTFIDKYLELAKDSKIKDVSSEARLWELKGNYLKNINAERSAEAWRKALNIYSEINNDKFEETKNKLNNG